MASYFVTKEVEAVDSNGKKAKLTKEEMVMALLSVSTFRNRGHCIDFKDYFIFRLTLILNLTLKWFFVKKRNSRCDISQM